MMESKRARILLVLATLLVAGLVHGRPAPLLDLTHELNNNTIGFPSHVPFQSLNRRVVEFGLIKFATGEFLSSEHSGTHMDSPIHFAEGHWTMEMIPLEYFEGPAVVINITDRATADPDAMVSVQDLEDWEKEHGTMPDGSIVIMNSGYSKHFWTNATAYFGAPKGQVHDMHYPGFSGEACAWLVKNRKIHGVGVDSVSADNGPSTDFKCHKAVSEDNKFVLENLANVHELPASGAVIRAYPLKMTGATGSPSRVIALLPNDKNKRSTANCSGN